jgi:hypothetical protein
LAGVFRRITQAREGLGGEGERLCRAYKFAPSASQICTELLTSMGRRRAAAILAVIVMAIVMVMAVSRGHVEVTMVPMPVSLADANADVADLNSDVFRNDHWFVAGAQRAGKRRHRWKRNNKKGE